MFGHYREQATGQAWLGILGGSMEGVGAIANALTPYNPQGIKAGKDTVTDNTGSGFEQFDFSNKSTDIDSYMNKFNKDLERKYKRGAF